MSDTGGEKTGCPLAIDT